MHVRRRVYRGGFTEHHDKKTQYVTHTRFTSSQKGANIKRNASLLYNRREPDMKFRRQERYSYHWTPAKEAAYLRKPQRVLNKLAERYPLIADQLTTSQSSLESEKQRREELSNKSEMNMRNFRANQWRKARKLYFSCDQNTREIIKQAWQNGVYPADPTYLIYVIEKTNGDYQRRCNFYAEQDRIRREETARIYNARENQIDLFKRTR
ncbi:hypothetical protein NMA32_003632 [Salmonella enterica]|uniref:Uncharacterized protein n=4 Tax=Salmonella TaxID=590 RepID=A0A760M0U9_SALER|nr:MULTISPECIES: hypothetical protein [Salmonella]EAV5730412.1 hypothetical protein [Salmonella enterica]ECW6162038.1 hypothetical protein [Salmonella enterica subsp. enterica serovar Montevideo]EDQ3384495.1 hypothetical protein [Salmonella enterica subsp. enterica serovar Uzaramo]EDS7335421.1 hypothetical protein [Salmonella enterica subsp. enterica serovar Pomona]EDX4559642.1 hypothetical protein [Salmonella enterica subsp. enterica serovar Hvittingfoss]